LIIHALKEISMATLKDVAKDVGVSVATVSYVLNKTGSVSVEMQKRVLAAVDRLNYQPNRQAQAMRTGKTNTIGLVLPDLTNPFFPELAQKVENEARARGISVILIDAQNSKEAEKEGINTLNQQNVDGIIWCPTNNQVANEISVHNKPTVLIDRPHPGFDVVHSNYHSAGAIAAEHAVALGHQRIGLLSGPQDIESAIERRKGIINTASGRLNIVWDVDVPFSSELNEEAIQLLKSSSVSLVLAASDLIAIGAINILRDAGIRVPEDISIIGFDDIPWASLVRPRLTTVSQPIADMGREAVLRLCQRIEEPAIATRSVVLDVGLVERESAIAFVD
jgi:LacI family transcriptional regulator